MEKLVNDHTGKVSGVVSQSCKESRLIKRVVSEKHSAVSQGDSAGVFAVLRIRERRLDVRPRILTHTNLSGCEAWTVLIQSRDIEQCVGSDSALGRDLSAPPEIRQSVVEEFVALFAVNSFECL